MQIFDNLAHEKAVQKGEFPTLLCVPESRYVNGDSKPFNVVSVETIRDVIVAIDSKVQGLVISFGDKQEELLQCLADHGPALIGHALIVLTGLEDTEYTTLFDKITWSNEKVSVMTILDSMFLNSDRKSFSDPNAKSIYTREQKGATRSNGGQKEFERFDVANVDDVEEE